MKKSYVLVFVLMAALSACGPSEQEKALEQKKHDDSLAVVVKNKIEHKNEIENQIISTKDQIQKLKNELSEAKGDAAAAADKMIKIKEWQFGRTSSEREEQVKNQTIIIDEANRKVSEIESAIVDAEASQKELELALKEF